jgi:hypothetical protein
MLINSIAFVLGLTRIFVHFSTAGLQRLVKAALVPAFADLWLWVISVTNGIRGRRESVKTLFGHYVLGLT